ncbi:hypothetical protein CsSME_00049601 [Camellia sinensis var. sinensis]
MPQKIGQLTNLKTLNTFVVGKSTDCSLLAELKCFHIDHIKRVNVSQLQLNWESSLPVFESQGNVESEAQENVKSELVLEALQPHPNLKELDVTGYEGTRFPLWMRGSCLQNVVKIKLSRCKNFLQLPPLGQTTFATKPSNMGNGSSGVY